MKNAINCLLGVLIAQTLHAQVVFKEENYAVDHTKKIILCNDLRENISSTEKLLQFDDIYELSYGYSRFRKGDVVEVIRNDTSYKVYFSEVPIVKINVSNIDDINREKELMGTVQVQDFINPYQKYPMGIRIRGATSALFPKKGYRVQIKDENQKNKDVSFFGLRSDKRWLLLAMWNERIRLNNRISHQLWINMHPLYYADKEPNAVASIRTRYVDVFINGSYNGVYLFTEDTDQKQLGLKKTGEDGEVRGQLYKGDDHGNTDFSALPPMVAGDEELWGGWELKHPDPEDHSWQDLYDFTDFVRNSTAENFAQAISQKIHIDNSIDYFIFLNLLHAIDNRGKNTFLARYDKNEPYFYGVWDLDGTWGYDYFGIRLDVTDKILSNLLFDRLMEEYPPYKSKLAERWFELRNSVLSTDALFELIDGEYNYLFQNKVYERENPLWPLVNTHNELNYIKNWVRKRVAFLDDYFEQKNGECYAPTIELVNKSFSKGDQIKIVGSDCKGQIKWFKDLQTTSFYTGGVLELTIDKKQTFIEAQCVQNECVSDDKTFVELIAVD